MEHENGHRNTNKARDYNPENPPVPTDADIATVAAIISKTAAGKSPSEIADELGVKLAVRVWDGLSYSRLCQYKRILHRYNWIWHVRYALFSVIADWEWPIKRPFIVPSVGAHYYPGQHVGIHSYSLNSATSLRNTYGYVAFWGKVITGTEGYLAEKAYPLSISDVELAKIYGVQYVPLENLPLEYIDLS